MSGTKTWASLLRGVAELGQRSADRLENIDLTSLPASAAKKVEQLWANQHEFVLGVTSLIEGLSVMQQHVLNLSSQIETLRARVETLELHSPLLKRDGSNSDPLSPSSGLHGDVCLEEAIPDSRARR